MVAAFGIAFEFPVLLVALQLIGIVTPQTLLKGWRYAIMAIFVIAAVITPSGDPYSMLALALPMSRLLHDLDPDRLHRPATASHQRVAGVTRSDPCAPTGPS